MDTRVLNKKHSQTKGRRRNRGALKKCLVIVLALGVFTFFEGAPIFAKATTHTHNASCYAGELHSHTDDCGAEWSACIACNGTGNDPNGTHTSNWICSNYQDANCYHGGFSFVSWTCSICGNYTVTMSCGECYPGYQTLPSECTKTCSVCNGEGSISGSAKLCSNNCSPHTEHGYTCEAYGTYNRLRANYDSETSNADWYSAPLMTCSSCGKKGYADAYYIMLCCDSCDVWGFLENYTSVLLCSCGTYTYPDHVYTGEYYFTTQRETYPYEYYSYYSKYGGNCYAEGCSGKYICGVQLGEYATSELCLISEWNNWYEPKYYPCTVCNKKGYTIIPPCTLGGKYVDSAMNVCSPVCHVTIKEILFKQQ